MARSRLAASLYTHLIQYLHQAQTRHGNATKPDNDSDPPARVPACHVARQRHVEVGEDSMHVETGALASQGAAEHPDTG